LTVAENGMIKKGDNRIWISLPSLLGSMLNISYSTLSKLKEFCVGELVLSILKGLSTQTGLNFFLSEW